MSATVLQRVVVRMLHDPTFRAAVYADPDAALAGLSLSPAERRMLVAPDARAWGVDEHRADRVLAALLDEFPVTALVLLEDGVVLARLAGFFRSPSFHDAIMARRSLAPAFAVHLAVLASRPRARSVVALEGAIAGLRRVSLESRPAIPTGHLSASPRVRPIELAAGTLAAWDKAKQAMSAGVTQTLVAAKRPRVAPVDARATEWVLLETRGTEPVAGFIGEALGRLLQAAERPVTREALRAVAEREGADAGEADEILDDLLADALLIAG